MENRNKTTEDLVLNQIMSIMGSSKRWIGTMTDLAFVMTEGLNRRQINSLPASPSYLRVVLNRIINRVRCRGISVRFGRTTDRTRTRYVSFSR